MKKSRICLKKSHESHRMSPKKISEKIYKYIFFIGALHDLLGGSWVIMRDYTAS